MRKEFDRLKVAIAYSLIGLVFLISQSCGGNNSTPPTVLSVSPEDSLSNVSAKTSVSVTFSNSMNTASAEAAFSINPNVTGTFSWDSGNTVMTYTPSSDLVVATQQYTCSVGAAAKDITGQALSSPYQWKWTTWANDLVNLTKDSLFDSGYSVTTDPSGNTYLAGTLKGNADFGTYFTTSKTVASAEDSDIFLTKINANGTYGWTKLIGGAGDESEPFVTTDPSGNVYLSGIFGGTVDFGADFGATDVETSAGSSNSFLTMLNADGTYAWTEQGRYASEDSLEASYGSTEQGSVSSKDNMLSSGLLKGNLKRHVYNNSKTWVTLDNKSKGWGNLHLEGCDEAGHVVNGPCTIKPGGAVEMEFTTDKSRYSGNIWFSPKGSYGSRWIYYEGGWFTKGSCPFCWPYNKSCSMSIGGNTGTALSPRLPFDVGTDSPARCDIKIFDR